LAGQAAHGNVSSKDFQTAVAEFSLSIGWLRPAQT